MKLFNFWKNVVLELEEGETICPECNGQGMKKIFNDRPTQFSSRIACKKCLGDGKFDWVEKVMGKQSLSLEGKIIEIDAKWKAIIETLYDKPVTK